MNTRNTSREGTLSEIRRYAISSVLLIALLGLLPAACSKANTDRPDVSGGSGAATSGGSGTAPSTPTPNN